jgi:cell division protein FtsQ
MDPRLRQRRTEVIRNQGRRRLRLLLVAVTVPALVLGAMVVLRSSWLSVSHVRVVGERQTPVAAIQRSVAAALHRPLINLDLGRLEQDVDALPWVQHATIRRSWPSTLLVSIAERAPVATVTAGGRFVEVDATGRVLTLTGSAAAGEPKLSGSAPAGIGPGASLGASLGGELAVAAALPASLRSRVAVIGPEGDGGVQLSLVQPGGARVELGPSTEMQAKLAALETVLAQVDLTGVKVIDLRVPGQPALTRS